MTLSNLAYFTRFKLAESLNLQLIHFLNQLLVIKSGKQKFPRRLVMGTN